VVTTPPPPQVGPAAAIPTAQYPTAPIPQGVPVKKPLDAHDFIRYGDLLFLAIFVVMAVVMLLFPKPEVATGPAESPPRTRQASDPAPAISSEQIRIDNVRLVPWQSPTTGEALQMVLVDWTNKSGKEVKAITATITLYDARPRSRSMTLVDARSSRSRTITSTLWRTTAGQSDRSSPSLSPWGTDTSSSPTCTAKPSEYGSRSNVSSTSGQSAT